MMEAVGSISKLVDILSDPSKIQAQMAPVLQILTGISNTLDNLNANVEKQNALLETLMAKKETADA